jgi:DNA-binding NarL/FixJ family response regulator
MSADFASTPLSPKAKSEVAFPFDLPQRLLNKVRSAIFVKGLMDTHKVPLAVRVLVADNNVIQTELLGQAVAKDRRMRVVELSTSSGEALRGVQYAHPDVLLISETLDQRAGGGLDVVREMRRTLPELKSIVLLDCSDKESVVRAFRAGARGVFCRNHPVKMLCKCIVAVNEGQIWANSSELAFLVEAVSASSTFCCTTAENLSALSDREREVVNCIAQGLSNRDIATRLRISQHTVKNYMFRIFEKLGVSSRLELLFYVMSRTEERRTLNHAELTVINQGKGPVSSYDGGGSAALKKYRISERPAHNSPVMSGLLRSTSLK